MAIGTLYISYQEFDFSNFDSKFLCKKNLNTAINDVEVLDYHTSLEDVGLTAGEIDDGLLAHCEEIKFLALNWERVINLDNHLIYAQAIDIATSKFNNTGAEDVINQLANHCNFHRNTRKTTDPVLWTVGASFTSAFGVEDEERWGHLVANELNVNEVNLAKSEASIWDGADQILRSDVQKGDIVIWGLPPAGRVEAVVENKLRSCPIRLAEEFDFFTYKLDHFHSNTQYLVGLREIHQVINFCNRLQVKLYIVNFTEPVWFPLALRSYERFLNLQHTLDSRTFLPIMIDYGTELLDHPGPRQHQEYAEKISKFIREKNDKDNG